MTLDDVVAKDFEALRRSIDSYDRAAEAYPEIFKGVLNNQDLIIKRVELLYASATTEEARILVGCAFNYAIFSAYAKAGEQEEMKLMLKDLLENDRTIMLIGHFLQEMGLSFSELSIERGMLLSPNQISDIVFEKYAPASASQSRLFAQQQGCSVIVEGKGQPTLLRVAYVRFGKNPDTKQSAIFFHQVSDTTHDSVSAVEQTIKNVFEGLAVQNYSLIHCVPNANPAVISYLTWRYVVSRMGQAVHDFTPLRGDLNPRIKFEEG